MSGKYNMEISQGADYKLGLTIKDDSGTEVDLTGHTFSGQIRKTASDPTILASFTFTILDQVTDTGRVDVELPAAASSAIPVDRSRNASRTITTLTYDIESIDPATKTVRWLEGTVKLSPEVTK